MFLPVIFLLASQASAKLEPTVECDDKTFNITLNIADLQYSDVYLEYLKGFDLCKPTVTQGLLRFSINLTDEFRCGSSRMTNQMTGDRIFFHRVILELKNKTDDLSNNTENAIDDREIILAKCEVLNPTLNRTRRQALPDFPEIVEPDHINITQYIEAKAPIPTLDLGIKQHGRLLDTTYNVEPGTPLEMSIKLDPASKSTYGILASFLRVSDSAGKQEEIIVMNGCSIDPYIFDNFVTPDNGDSLSATFKAFKFPESNYVMFSGTVAICINQCKGVPCGNDQFGYGRRRREVSDPNAIYSVDMTTMLKVQFNEDLFTLQKGSVAADFKNDTMNHHGMNEIEGVDVAEQYSGAERMSFTYSLLVVGFIVFVKSRWDNL